MFKKAMIAGAVVLASVGANAASANLSVTGTITPEACAVTLGNGGVVDYGALSAVTVKAYPATGSTNLVYTAPTKTISLDVTCSAPTAVALNWTDNRAASKIAVDANDVSRFGLGTQGSTNIGNYLIGFGSLQYKATSAGTLTGPAGYLTRAKNTTGAWTTTTSVLVNLANAMGFKQAAADTAPPAIAQIAGNLIVYGEFSKSLVDAATSAITLNGSSTVNVEYI